MIYSSLVWERMLLLLHIEYTICVMSCSFRLKPGCKCHITISYVSELDLLHCSKKPTIRFVVPTTIAPRYSPSQKGISSPDGTQALYADAVPYKIEFICQVEKLHQHVSTISSPSHPIKIDISSEENFLVTFAQQEITLE